MHEEILIKKKTSRKKPASRRKIDNKIIFQLILCKFYLRHLIWKFLAMWITTFSFREIRPWRARYPSINYGIIWKYLLKREKAARKRFTHIDVSIRGRRRNRACVSPFCAAIELAASEGNREVRRGFRICLLSIVLGRSKFDAKSAESRSSLALYLLSVHIGERSSRFSSGHFFF